MQRRPSIAVVVDGPIGISHLFVWGRAPDGWWAYVSWNEDVIVRPKSYRGVFRGAGWVPADALTRFGQPVPTVGVIPRVRIDGEHWPSYDLGNQRVDQCFGRLDPTAPRPLPDGYERINFALASHRSSTLK